MGCHFLLKNKGYFIWTQKHLQQSFPLVQQKVSKQKRPIPGFFLIEDRLHIYCPDFPSSYLITGLPINLHQGVKGSRSLNRHKNVSHIFGDTDEYWHTLNYGKPLRKKTGFDHKTFRDNQELQADYGGSSPT